MTSVSASEKFNAAYLTLGASGGMPAELEGIFAAWYALLIQWNKKINLTRVSEPEAAVIGHLLDSLPLAQAAPPDISLLDIGSGAGAPGLIVAALRPDLRVTCAESAAKKAAFLAQAVHAMQLQNVRIENVRAEALAARFDLIAARAVAPPPELARRFGHLLRSCGRFAFFLAEQTESALPPFYVIGQTINYELPAGQGKRKLILAEKAP
jgi:16S rRNA (guanine527-N7)-methyltransferase